jgi:hypothetical protein
MVIVIKEKLMLGGEVEWAQGAVVDSLASAANHHDQETDRVLDSIICADSPAADALTAHRYRRHQSGVLLSQRGLVEVSVRAGMI